jgi:hypothetical protein
MKYLVVSVILFFCTLQTFGQQDYFIYLQTDNNQPFYVRLNNNVISSSHTGYLILSRMPDTTCALTIGFPKNAFPEQQFAVPVNRKDGGYLLKNFADKGWGLFNLQTMAVIMNSNPPEEKKSPEITGSRKNDAFSMLLANAVNDSSVLYTVNRPKKIDPPPAQKLSEEKQPATTAANAKDTARTDQVTVKQPADTVQRDSSFIAIVKATTVKDSLRNATAAKTVADTAKEPVADNKTKLPNNTSVNASTPAAAQNTAQQKDSIAAGKMARNTTAKNKKERKDTIIIMKGNTVEGSKPLAKKQPLKKDSIGVAQLNKKPITTPPAGPLPKQVNMPSDSVKPIVGQQPPVQDTVAAIVKNESPPPTVEEKKDTAAAPPANRRLRPLVTKAAELLTDTSYVAVFVDETKEKFDTIRISIPFNEYLARTLPHNNPGIVATTDSLVPAKKVIDSLNEVVYASSTKDSLQVGAKKQAEELKATPTQPLLTANDSVKAIVEELAKQPLTNPATATPSKDERAKLPPVIVKDSLSLSSPPPSVNTLPKDTTTVTPTPPVMDSGRIIKAPQQALFMNSDCKEVAWDGDIDKLRIKMLLVDGDEEKIGLAKKVFKQKCLLARQVKALSELFKTDEGKHKWLDAAYPHVSDSGNFYKLGELIKDDYYFNRFKAMLRN